MTYFDRISLYKIDLFSFCQPCGTIVIVHIDEFAANYIYLGIPAGFHVHAVQALFANLQESWRRVKNQGGSVLQTANVGDHFAINNVEMHCM